MPKHLQKIVACILLATLLVLAGCSGGGSSSGTSANSGTSGNAEKVGEAMDADTDGTTSGPLYSEPNQILLSPFDPATAAPVQDGLIGASTASQGYAGISAKSENRLKFQVVNGNMSYNYDVPTNGDPIIAPINMGNGNYQFRLMMNTTGSSYVEIGSVTQDVVLEDEFLPFLRPNVFCDYGPDSTCVAKAFDLAVAAENEGDVVRDIYDWMVANIRYDDSKAAKLMNTTGYVPDPDDTFSSKRGICFDYASLAAAMFRSLGIPCKIVTGYVSPNDLYHAWNLIFIDGSWITSEISVVADKWCRVDVTFAASDGGNALVGDGFDYTDKYVY